MSTVLEEKVPRVMSPIVQQYGPIGQSAAEAVSEGLKKVVSFGVGSVGEKGFENIANPTETIFGKLNAINCPIIGSKISEPAAFALAEDHTQSKGIWVQNPELNAFTKNVFGKNGVQSVIGDISQAGTEKGMIINGKTNQAEFPNPIAEEAIVGPEYFVFKNMEQTLKNTLSLQDDLLKSKLQFRA